MSEVIKLTTGQARTEANIIMGICGKMLSWSKGQYRREHPDNEVVFNANIYAENHGKIWWGDLDVTLEKENIEQLAKTLHTKIYVLREMDGRFENEALPNIDRAVYSYP